MTPAEKIKLISYLKANAAELLRTVADDHLSVTTEHSGKSLAMLKLVALGRQEVAAGRIVPAREAIESLRSRLSDDGRGALRGELTWAAVANLTAAHKSVPSRVW